MRAEITSQSAMHSSAIFNVLLRESGELGQPVRAQMISQGEQGLETLARSNKMRLVEPVAGYSGQDTHLCVGQNDGEEHVRQKIRRGFVTRSEEHTSELQSLMRISYAVFCLKKKIKKQRITKMRNYSITQPNINKHSIK